MTEKRRSERFNFFLPAVLLSLAVSCSSAPVSTASTASPGKPDAVKPSDPDIRAEMLAADTMDGTITLVTVKLAPALEGKEVSGEFEGIELPFYKDGEVYRAVLGIPLDHKPGPVAVKVRVGTGADLHSSEAAFNVVPGNYPTTTETLKVDSRLVHPNNPKDLARIKKEVEEIGEIYGTVTRKKYWNGPFAFPVKDANYTSSFGKRRIYNGVQTSPHTGLDLKAKQGTPIFAPAPGRVVLAKNLFFTGNTVILDHGYGVLTLYAHMSKLKTKKGKEVKPGELLGLAGMTGRANGPHLHWMAIIQKQKVNPLGLTQVMK
jgi:hypothetical protein